MLRLIAILAVGCATSHAAPAQGIARTMGACLDGLYAQEINSVALECTCEAERACVAAGLPKGCAFDEWALETRGHHIPIVGHCGDR